MASEDKKIIAEELQNVSGGYSKLCEFTYTVTYLDKSNATKTTSVSASGFNRNAAMSLAKEKAEDWCKENGYTYVSIA